MNVSELRQLNTKKLFAALREKRRELAVARFHVKTGQSANTAVIRKIRKTVARIITLLSGSQK